MFNFPESLSALASGTKGFMPDEEGMGLFHFARSIPESVPGPIVEVGSYCGLSTIYLGEACRQSGRRLITVDHHRGSEEMLAPSPYFDPSLVDSRTGRIDTLPSLRRTVELAGLEDTVTCVVGISQVVAELIKPPLACVFIDGGHGSLQEWLDYADWSKYIALGGLLMIHDVFEDPAEGGRPPYEIFIAASTSKEFQPAGQVGSLRALVRIS